MAVLCLLAVVAAVSGFNVDLESRVVHKGSPASMFGFTVQAHVDGTRKMLLVGAPEDDPGRRPDVTRPGSVYRCYPYHSECSEMIFDRTGNNVDVHSRQIDQKSNQWFGATLTSTGLNGPIVACAPRYVSFVSSKLNQRDPVGACFIAKSSDSHEINEYSPCRTSTHGQRKTGVCQAGFSAAISKDGERLFMGAPGSWYWQGRAFSIDSNERFLYFMPKIPEEGQLFSQGVKQPILISTPESDVKYDDSYMGYSVTVGDFAGQAMQGVAVGVPRGSELRGLVVIYTWELQNIKNISGSQIGAYFGYSLASGDIDGDGYDDVIVGAPMFTRPKSDGYEHGRVYVIYQGKDRSFSRNHARTGEISKGRFGLSLTSLGDINLDGFGDFAVGAPYSGDNGRGVVFIYHGSAEGVSEKYSQAILAEDVGPSITTFGFSVSGGVDLDNNNYTDLAVGAYKSDSVVFFRSRPVVKVMAEFKFLGESKLISLDEKKCQLANGTRISCAHLTFCLTYDGINVNQQIYFEVTLDLDSKQVRSKRLFLIEGRTSTYKENILLTQGQQECRDVTVYLDEDIRDKLTPLEVAMSYELITQRIPGAIPPVLDQTLSNVYTDSLNIQKNCGSDNVCIPDLQMAVTTTTVNYVLGSNENVNIDVEVLNAGEDAFEAAYYLRIPPGVNYAKMKRLEEEASDDTPMYCSIIGKTSDGNSTLRCDMGNPLASHQRVNFRIILDVDPSVTSLDFDMHVNSTNPEQGTGYDNKRHLKIGVLVKAQLSVIGTSDPPELHYNASLYESGNVTEDTKLGPQLIHKYNIKNEGPFAVEQAEIYIMWPHQTLAGDTLMYMVVQPQWVGSVTCDVARNVNPYGMFVKNPYNFYLQKEWEAYQSSEFAKTEEESSSGSNHYYWEQNINNKNAGGGGYSHRWSSGTQTNHAVDRKGSEEYEERFVDKPEVSSRINYGRNQGSYGQNFNRSQGSSNQGVYTQAGSQGSSFRQESSQGSYNKNQDSYSQNQGNYNQNQGSYNQGSYQNKYNQGSYASQSGYGGGARADGGGRTRQWNRTVIYDEQGNVVSQTESSTEYGSLGHEGEAGSSFSNRYGASESHQGGYRANQNQRGQWVHGFDASATNDQRHSWSTEESINRDLMSAGSRRHGQSGVTVVGDEGDELGGLGARAALNTNNEFRVGYADLGVSGSGAGGEYSQSHGGRSSGHSSSRASSSGGYSSSWSSQTGEASYNTRRRRQDQVDPELSAMLDKCQEKFRCEVVRCVTGYLAKGQELWIALRSRINASVLNEISQERAVKVSSLATASVAKLPLVGAPSSRTWQTSEAVTLVTPQLEAPTSGSIPLWVVVLAAVAGALLLLLLVFALYKCGFFKRNRPSDHAERQPLNGRDEHL